uniref:G-protein coupled receptors family 1 profile domain-containing protein n=1 Tax=Onchocerca volvulus TaxID=6282 RepID=A0A8R1TMM0_ONCVO
MLTTINYILSSYAYLVVGTLLILVNIPVFLLVITREALRGSYLVLAIVFLNNGFTGIGAVSVGIKRLIIFHDGEKFINHHECVLNVTLLLLAAYFVDGFSLLMNSIERLCAVTFPIYYYIHITRISYSLIIAQYVITIIAITSIVIASFIQPSRRISNFCYLSATYSQRFYFASLQLSSAVTLLSIVFMIIVVITLKKKFGVRNLTSHSNNCDLSHFLKNQKRYTHTALISCCFTFFLVVVPSIMEEIYIMEFSSKAQIILVSCMYLRMLNSFNMAVVFLYRQKDFRHTAIQCFKNLFYKRKPNVQPIAVIAFGG